MKNIMNSVGVGCVIAASIMLSGCGITTSYMTDLHVSHKSDRTLVTILVDQDATSLGGIMIGSVVRTNYMYSFAVASTKTIDAGYEYFTIVHPAELVEQLRDRDVTNVQEAYDACDAGDGSFIKFGVTYTYNLGSNRNNCDVMTNRYTNATLTGGTVVHKSVAYTFEMHNGSSLSPYATFKAKDVLASELVSDLDESYFVEGKR
jgi:hypothetical protein